MPARSKRSTTRLPRHGNALVSVTVRDANGFLHRYDDIETDLGAVQEALAIMQLKSAEMDAAHRSAMGA
ncbi:hypothetical protein [Microbacterium yannicii]|jgi:hypothetical protein|uniref:hypothetical protein n=1 Tax=Microbacterium yannicii TaxID=671622 RepID=UPI0002D5F38D|nr:hypothetical protein [Microbacterium yannicii]